jgi:hypothetical protein
MVAQWWTRSRDSVGDVVWPRYMPYVPRELGYEIDVVELLRWASVLFLLEGVGDGFMVSEDDELARFQHVAEMLLALVDSQQPSIVGALFPLGRVQLLGDECKGLPGVARCCPTAGSGCDRRMAPDKLVFHTSWRPCYWVLVFHTSWRPCYWVRALQSRAQSPQSCDMASVSCDGRGVRGSTRKRLLPTMSSCTDICRMTRELGFEMHVAEQVRWAVVPLLW